MSEKLGLVGRKIGMTRIFTEEGVSIPVTVLDVSGNRVTQVKTEETDVHVRLRAFKFTFSHFLWFLIE